MHLVVEVEVPRLPVDRGNVRKQVEGEGDEDTFGANDDDWAIYREIQNADDRNREEEVYNNLAAIETRLLTLDPTFGPDDTYAARLARKNRLDANLLQWPWWRRRSLHRSHRCRYERRTPTQPSIRKALNDSINSILNVERIRVPEVLFQPSIAGLDQAGLDEICAHVVHSFDASIRAKMLQNIFVTGRHTGTKALRKGSIVAFERFQPSNVLVQVKAAKDRRFDAWKGAARWSVSEEKASEGDGDNEAGLRGKGQRSGSRNMRCPANWK